MRQLGTCVQSNLIWPLVVMAQQACCHVLQKVFESHTDLPDSSSNGESTQSLYPFTVSPKLARPEPCKGLVQCRRLTQMLHTRKFIMLGKTRDLHAL